MKEHRPQQLHDVFFNETSLRPLHSHFLCSSLLLSFSLSLPFLGIFNSALFHSPSSTSYVISDFIHFKCHSHMLYSFLYFSLQFPSVISFCAGQVRQDMTQHDVCVCMCFCVCVCVCDVFLQFREYLTRFNEIYVIVFVVSSQFSNKSYSLTG